MANSCLTMAAYPGLSAAREKASVILDEAEALLDPVSDIEGFMLACLVDASTGMVLASRKDQDEISLPTAAAGAADIANVLSQRTGRASGGRPRGRDGDVPPPALRDTPGQPEPQILLLVILDRDRANLAMARRAIRTFCASFAA